VERSPIEGVTDLLQVMHAEQCYVWLEEPAIGDRRIDEIELQGLVGKIEFKKMIMAARPIYDLVEVKRAPDEVKTSTVPAARQLLEGAQGGQ
jgi:hypothetical protein